MSSGMLASTSGKARRPTRAATAQAAQVAITKSGPVQPRTPSAMSASARAMVSLVAGFSRR
jgi:hypothetical protein